MIAGKAGNSAKDRIYSVLKNKSRYNRRQYFAPVPRTSRNEPNISSSTLSPFDSRFDSREINLFQERKGVPSDTFHHPHLERGTSENVGQSACIQSSESWSVLRQVGADNCTSLRHTLGSSAEFCCALVQSCRGDYTLRMAVISFLRSLRDWPSDGGGEGRRASRGARPSDGGKCRSRGRLGHSQHEKHASVARERFS